MSLVAETKMNVYDPPPLEEHPRRIRKTAGQRAYELSKLWSLFKQYELTPKLYVEALLSSLNERFCVH